MIIYKAEREAGLADKIRQSTFLAYLTVPTVIVDDSEKSRLLESKAFKAIFDRTIAEKQKQIDLFYMQDILVTAGVVNGNDDLFLPEEVYAARHTPEDKPFNLGHENTDIIGHITAQHLIDDNGNLIADDVEADDLPKKFHVVNNTVIYRVWSDEKRLEQITQIISEIETSKPPKWFVSMEALFAAFDYGLLSTNDELEIVPRNKTTAFLTKYLRAYGGNGTYDNKRIVRVLRNFVFSGKGLVEQPANPESVIFAKSFVTNSINSQNISTFSLKNTQLIHEAGYVLNSKDDKENCSMNELELLKEQLKQTQVTLAGEKAANTELQNQLKAVNEKEYQGKLDTLTAQVKAYEAKNTELLADVKANKDQLDKLTQDKANLEVSLKEANQKLADAEKDKAKATRLNELKTKLLLDDAQAVKLFETVADISDEKFAKFVEASPKAIVAAVTKTETETDVEALAKAEAEKNVGAVATTQQDSKLTQALASIRTTIENRRTQKQNKVTK